MVNYNEFPLRILHVLTAMNRAGTETLLMNLYRNIDRNRIQFDFAITSKDHCDYENEIISLGGRIIRYPLYVGKNHFSYVRWWHAFYASHPEYKIIHGHIGSTAAIYLSIAKKYGCFTIAHSHSTNAKISLHSILYRVFSYPTRFIADYFFGCSMAALEDRYGKKIAHDKKRASVLNNAIDAKQYIYNPQIRAEVRNELNIDQDEFVFGTVGRLTIPKNPFMIVNIVKEFKKQKVPFKFIWVGTGELKKDIKNLIRAEKLENEILMLGARDDVPRILQALDVFIFPSLWEGLGIVAIEAQAAGLPTLCSDKIVPEINFTSLVKYLKLHNLQEWIRCLIDVKNTPRKNTYKNIIEAEYDIAYVTNKLEDFYCKIFKTTKD